MAKFEMYQQFANRKSGRIAHVARVDDVCKTIILMYDEAREGDKENGVTLSYPSVSKNWKRLDSFAHPDLSKSEVKSEDKASDGTAYSEVMQEIVEDEKKAVKKAKADKKDKSKKEKKETVAGVQHDITLESIADIIRSSGFEAVFNTKKNEVVLKDKKSLVEFYVRKSFISVWTREAVVERTKDLLATLEIEAVHHPNCSMKYQFNMMPDIDNISKFISAMKED